MSIKEEIARLQQLEAKIELYEQLRRHVVAVDANAEFKAEVSNFIDARIAAINGAPAPRTRAAEPESATPPAPAAKLDPDADPADPLSFSLKYRHLAGKEITFTTPDGEVKGVVRGCVVPNLIVITSLGYQVKIDPKTIIKEG